MSKRQPRTVLEAIDGLLSRTVEGEQHLPVQWCARGLWLDDSRGAHCSARCRLLRAFLAGDQAIQLALMEAA